jgi:thiol-disulfide isomerase/thioredoxin
MIRKSFLLLIVTSLLASAIFMIYVTMEKLNHKSLIQQNLKSLPKLTLFDLDSARFYLVPDRKTILIYFNSECGNCQYELEEIIKNKNSFADSNIVLISSELISTIKSFAEKSCTSGLNNMRFTKINGVQAYEVFGHLVVPQIFIYGHDGLLIKRFQGETKIDAILPYL